VDHRILKKPLNRMLHFHKFRHFNRIWQWVMHDQDWLGFWVRLMCFNKRTDLPLKRRQVGYIRTDLNQYHSPHRINRMEIHLMPTRSPQVVNLTTPSQQLNQHRSLKGLPHITPAHPLV